ncbi:MULTISPECIES: HNH endonuclease signature motif containing protein [Micrococcaceae]|uniref:HNH endonuclease n=1 Tax=Micrococcaceae TaxID=1268 RepID=UPI001036B11C|nr:MULTISPECIES: HNH endonuclease signature motif containing protein [Micrococcaceae]TAP28599.1 HNH endonuclease [Arthrobacter sp. S41]UXN32570.1 HNH endonuclease [Glutamicibacter sp. M10]
MTHPYFEPDDDDEHRLPLDPPATRSESQSDSFFTDHLEHQMFYGPMKELVDELFNAGPLNGPGDGLARLEKVQKLDSMLSAVSAAIMADSVEQVAQAFAEDTVTKPHFETEQERRERLCANYYRVDPTSDQVITSNFVAEAAIALRETTEKARGRMFTAKGLRHVCPETLQALAAGQITAAAARAMVKYSQDLTQEQINLMQENLLPIAATASDETITQRIRRFHDQVRPESADARHKKAADARKVSSWDLQDGMSALKLVAPSVNVKSIVNTLKYEATLHNDPEDTRTQAQLEADIFCDALINGWPTTNGTPLKPRVVVTIPALQMIANPDRALADLEGYGPIPMGAALQIAKDAPSIIPMLTDPFSGAVMDVGRKRYKPTRVLKEFLRARDQHCCYPGCRRTADNSEVDHVDAWETGGHTNRANTELLCKQHQMFKHALGWKVINRPDGSKCWRTPHGLNSLVVPGSVDNVQHFEHANDRCPERKVHLTPATLRVLGHPTTVSGGDVRITIDDPNNDPPGQHPDAA